MKVVLELMQFICSVFLSIGCFIMLIGALVINEGIDMFPIIVSLLMFAGCAYMTKVTFEEYKSEINN